jgi:hypothetical protein
MTYSTALARCFDEPMTRKDIAGGGARGPADVGVMSGENFEQFFGAPGRMQAARLKD